VLYVAWAYFCRKGILDPNKLPVMDVIDFAAMSDTDDLPLAVASPATGQTKSGRTSFKNELTKRYGSKYRDPDISEVLMGKLMPLGKAFGILAICMFGPNLPTEKHRHADRLRVWKNAAKYALNMNRIKVRVVSEWRYQKALVIYMQCLLTTALVSGCDFVSARTCPTVPAFWPTNRLLSDQSP
jgi:hypothetical protein